jgi:hypothetical protein
MNFIRKILTDHYYLTKEGTVFVVRKKKGWLPYKELIGVFDDISRALDHIKDDIGGNNAIR